MPPTLPGGFESRTTSVKDIEMHYVIGGTGSPLVIVHGGWDSWFAWRTIAPALAERHTVILPALRGLAGTTKAASGYDAANLGDDLYQLLTGLGHQRCAVVCHDFGAVASYALAALHPEMVERLAVFEMVLPGLGMLEQAIVPQPDGRYLWHMGFHSVPEIPEMLIDGHLREYMAWFFNAGAAAPGRVDDDAFSHYVELYAEDGAIPAFMNYYRQLWTSGEQIRSYTERGMLQMPVTAWGGDASIGPGVQACMSLVAADVSGGVIADCGHWVAEEQPAFVLAKIKEFLS
jgi:pimeloyl-ACP methyl ester carboxylesterase